MRPGWIAGAAAVALLAWVTFNTLRADGVGSKGLAAGTRAPPFAAPLALGRLEGDVNVARRPDAGQAGRRPACSVRGPDVLNLCALYERGPVVLAFLVTRGASCVRELDRLQALRATHRDLAFAAVALRGDRSAVRATVRRHGWALPVGYDRDGILANLYGVAGCPTITYVLPGGLVQGTSLGELDRAGLQARIAALERAASSARLAAVSAPPDAEAGWIERELALEFPSLALLSLAVAGPAGRWARADAGVAERLRALSDRFSGRRAVALRREPVPAAYRAFFHQVGLDPDARRTPVEAAVLERLMHGGFRSRGRLDDALLLAVVETGVPVWALDDARVDGPLGLRGARPGERLGEGPLASDLPVGRLVVADAERPVAVLFGEPAPDARPSRRCPRLRLVAVRVPGVPAIHAEEALWTAAEAVRGDLSDG